MRTSALRLTKPQLMILVLPLNSDPTMLTQHPGMATIAGTVTLTFYGIANVEMVQFLMIRFPPRTMHTVSMSL